MLWSIDGTWETLLRHVQAVADSEGDIDWDINIDSTSIRAHLHAAGAPKGPPPPCRPHKRGQRKDQLTCAHLYLRPFLEEAVRQARLSVARAAA